MIKISDVDLWQRSNVTQTKADKETTKQNTGDIEKGAVIPFCLRFYRRVSLERNNLKLSYSNSHSNKTKKKGVSISNSTYLCLVYLVFNFAPGHPGDEKEIKTCELNCS